MTANDVWARRFAFTAPFLVRMSMVGLRALGRGGGDSASFPHAIMQVIMKCLYQTEITF